MDALKVPIATQAKVGSILVHVEEGLSAKGHHFDWNAVESLMQDPDVVVWLDELRGLALIPEKR